MDIFGGVDMAYKTRDKLDDVWPQFNEIYLSISPLTKKGQKDIDNQIKINVNYIDWIDLSLHAHGYKGSLKLSLSALNTFNDKLKFLHDGAGFIIDLKLIAKDLRHCENDDDLSYEQTQIDLTAYNFGGAEQGAIKHTLTDLSFHDVNQEIELNTSRQTLELSFYDPLTAYAQCIAPICLYQRMSYVDVLKRILSPMASTINIEFSDQWKALNVIKDVINVNCYQRYFYDYLLEVIDLYGGVILFDYQTKKYYVESGFAEYSQNHTQKAFQLEKYDLVRMQSVVIDNVRQLQGEMTMLNTHFALPLKQTVQESNRLQIKEAVRVNLYHSSIEQASTATQQFIESQDYKAQAVTQQMKISLHGLPTRLSALPNTELDLSGKVFDKVKRSSFKRAVVSTTKISLKLQSPEQRVPRYDDHDPLQWEIDKKHMPRFDSITEMMLTDADAPVSYCYDYKPQQYYRVDARVVAQSDSSKNTHALALYQGVDEKGASYLDAASSKDDYYQLSQVTQDTPSYHVEICNKSLVAEGCKNLFPVSIHLHSHFDQAYLPHRNGAYVQLCCYSEHLEIEHVKRSQVNPRVFDDSVSGLNLGQKNNYHVLCHDAKENDYLEISHRDEQTESIISVYQSNLSFIVQS